MIRLTLYSSNFLTNWISGMDVRCCNATAFLHTLILALLDVPQRSKLRNTYCTLDFARECSTNVTGCKIILLISILVEGSPVWLWTLQCVGLQNSVFAALEYPLGYIWDAFRVKQVRSNLCTWICLFSYLLFSLGQYQLCYLQSWTLQTTQVLNLPHCFGLYWCFEDGQVKTSVLINLAVYACRYIKWSLNWLTWFVGVFKSI